MFNLSKTSKISLYIITILWSIIMLITSYLIAFGINISTHFSYNILIEFAESIALWYVISIAIILLFEIDKIKRR